MKQHEQYSDNELRNLSFRNPLFEGMTAREIYDNAAEFWNI